MRIPKAGKGAMEEKTSSSWKTTQHSISGVFKNIHNL